jgi:ubiquinone/menaquinone biosynthesis C-methylase UbiE
MAEHGGHLDYLAAKAGAIGSLRGRVLELGAGEGSNFAHLHADVEWLGLEPSRRRRSELARRARATGRAAAPLDGVAEDIPLPDRSVDAVLATVVLCSVRDQERALEEIHRVLVPGGRAVLAEHVAAPPGTLRRRLQGVAAPFSRLLDHGCDPTRDTEAAVRRSPLRPVRVERFAVPVLGRLTMPFVVVEAARRPRTA